MAQSLAHKWGQIIGELFELAANDMLATVAHSHGLYLDKVGPRKARPGKLVRWLDKFGNHHNLDYVMERGGTEEKIGTPVAFIELAWRRYTKHSKNKAQEIEGALVPLSDTYQHSKPVLGCVLGGDFTLPSLAQLKSRNFQVLYIPTSEIVAAFSSVGIDASYSEGTSEAEFATKIANWQSLSTDEIMAIEQHLVHSKSDQVQEFTDALNLVLSRTITSIAVVSLYGNSHSLETIEAAIGFLEAHDHQPMENLPFSKYEITVRYSNGDNIFGSFARQEDAIAFLKTFQ